MDQKKSLIMERKKVMKKGECLLPTNSKAYSFRAPGEFHGEVHIVIGIGEAGILINVIPHTHSN